jgi:hypothetical protein
MRLFLSGFFVVLSVVFVNFAHATSTTVLAVTPSQDSPPANCPDTGLVVGLTTPDENVIAPVCFEVLAASESQPPKTNIKNCEKDFGQKIIGTATSEGFVQSRYEMEDTSDLGIIMYRKVGVASDGIVIETRSFTGGTGRFSNVFVVKLDGDTLTRIRDIAAGDRCNNGVTDVKIDGKKVFTSMNITPADFTPLATGSDHGIKPYEDLEASAASCFAVATVDENGAVQNVTFTQEALDNRDPSWTEQYPLQACFNKLFRATLDSGKTQLDKATFTAWVENFLKVCKK